MLPSAAAAPPAGDNDDLVAADDDTDRRLAAGAVAPVAHEAEENGERKWAVEGVGVVDEDIVIRLRSLIR